MKVKHQIEDCTVKRVCPRCSYPIEGMTIVCPRCREPLAVGCSGNCLSCGHSSKSKEND